jgi:hypothetical protein
MSLTICTLGADGIPDDELDIGIQTHELLQDEAARLDLVLLLRMRDYYEDAGYSADELSSLIREAKAMRDAGDERIAPWLADLISLASRAIQKNCGLEVVCD